MVFSLLILCMNDKLIVSVSHQLLPHNIYVAIYAKAYENILDEEIFQK